MKKRNFLAVLVLAAACGGGTQRADTAGTDSVEPEPAPVAQPDTQVARTPTVTVSTDRRSYRPGDPVELRVVNETTGKYTYNPCTRTVERQSGAEWAEVQEERICTMIAHVLEASSTRVDRTELGEQLSPGTYRIAVRFTRDGPAARAQFVVAYSQPIAVTP